METFIHHFFYAKGIIVYGFIEKDLAEILVSKGVITEFEEYGTSCGNVAMLGISPFSMIAECISSMNGGYGNVATIPSDVNGMNILIHPFWMVEELFDALTPGHVKESDIYLRIRTAPSSTRFSWDQFKSDFAEAVDIYLGNGDDEDEEDGEPVNGTVGDAEAAFTNGAATEAPTILDEDEPEPEPVPEVDTAKEFVSAFFLRWGFTGQSLQLDDGGEVLYQWNSQILNKDVRMIASRLRRHVIILNGHHWSGSRIKSIISDMNEKDKSIKDKVLIIHTDQNHPKLCAPPMTMTHTLMGYEVGSIYQLHDLGTASDTYNPDHPLGASFAEFDFAYRDYKTGLIWAFQKGCEVYFTVNLATINSSLASLLLTEMVERFAGKLPYEEMVMRDIEHFEAAAKHDGEEFLKLAVTNSKKLIEDLKSEYLKAKESYEVALTKAMEHAKIAQRLEENLINFDESKMSEDERSRCEKMFNDVLAIPKVSAIKVSGDTVNVYTKNIYVRHEKNETWHDIGTFHIQIGMYGTTYNTSRTVKMFNTKHQIKAFNVQMQAPHVFEDGHLCHGNATAPMIDAYRRRDLYQMVLMLVMFLESANLDDSAGAYLKRWPVVSEEEATKPEEDLTNPQPAQVFDEQTEEEAAYDEELEIPIHI